MMLKLFLWALAFGFPTLVFLNYLFVAKTIGIILLVFAAANTFFSFFIFFLDEKDENFVKIFGRSKLYEAWRRCRSLIFLFLHPYCFLIMGWEFAAVVDVLISIAFAFVYEMNRYRYLKTVEESKHNDRRERQDMFEKAVYAKGRVVE